MDKGKEPSLKILKKGTLVKHGTTSRSLQGILDQGIRPRAHRYHARSAIEEAPVTEQAVYVGQYMAYCAAMLSFLGLAWEDAHSPSPQPKSAIPIVINIRLGEDCLVVADEDFVLLDQYDQHGRVLRTPEYISALFKATREEGLVTWEKYGSVGIVRPGGLPTIWIESIEHPKLKTENSQEIISDIELMLLSYRQQQEGLSFSEIAKQRWRFQTLGEAFSQCHSLSNEGIESYQKQEILNNISQLNEYVRELRGAIVTLGTYKHGLPFHG